VAVPLRLHLCVGRGACLPRL